jgi:tetratricopeptide (TPR) repeat protein
MESAEDLNERGLTLSEQGDAFGAEAAYRAAMAADPSWAAPYYNLGLLYKYQSRWPESLEFNQRAASLDDQHEAAWWNLGIAATALGNWSEARRAWVQCGLKLPPGDGPPDFNFGSTPVLERLAADLGGAAEDWGRSINILCAKCSRGLPHEHAPTPDHPAHPHCGLAARDDDHAEAIIHAWLEREPRADLIRWYAAGADAAERGVESECRSSPSGMPSL